METISGRGGKGFREGWKDFHGKVERKSGQGGKIFRAEKIKVERFSWQRRKENQGALFVKGERFSGCY